MHCETPTGNLTDIGGQAILIVQILEGDNNEDLAGKRSM
jgi:hypothetical protein